VGRTAHVGATAAIVDVGACAGLAAVGSAPVAVAVTGATVNSTRPASASRGAIGAVAHRAARAAVGGIRTRANFTAISRGIITVGKAGAARDLASSGVARGGAIGRGALGVARVAVVDVRLQVDFATVSRVAVAVGIAGVTGAHRASAIGAARRGVSKRALRTADVAIVNVRL
jgi:hypothetical protein